MTLDRDDDFKADEACGSVKKPRGATENSVSHVNDKPM